MNKEYWASSELLEIEARQCRIIFQAKYHIEQIKKLDGGDLTYIRPLVQELLDYLTPTP